MEAAPRPAAKLFGGGQRGPTDSALRLPVGGAAYRARRERALRTLVDGPCRGALHRGGCRQRGARELARRRLLRQLLKAVPAWHTPLSSQGATATIPPFGSLL